MKVEKTQRLWVATLHLYSFFFNKEAINVIDQFLPETGG
jgi:hypothetical protein